MPFGGVVRRLSRARGRIFVEVVMSIRDALHAAKGQETRIALRGGDVLYARIVGLTETHAAIRRRGAKALVSVPLADIRMVTVLAAPSMGQAS